MTGSRKDYTEITVSRDEALLDSQDLADYYAGDVIEVRVQDWVRKVETGEIFDVVRVGGGRHWNTGEARVRSHTGVCAWVRLSVGLWEKLGDHESALIDNELFDANEAYWAEQDAKYNKDWD